MTEEQVNVYDRFVDFQAGQQAAVELLERAQDQQAPIEFVVLAASVIDSFLREALIWSHQLKTGSMEIPEKLVYQAPKSGGISERGIYMMARNAAVITPELFARISDLYEDRNAVVHRYIISGITTERVLQIAGEYEELLQEVQTARGAIEDQLRKAGTGMPIELPEDMEIVDEADLGIDIEEPKIGTLDDKHGSAQVRIILGINHVDNPPSSKP